MNPRLTTFLLRSSAEKTSDSLCISSEDCIFVNRKTTNFFKTLFRRAMLKTILAISGKPGLYKLVSQAKNMLIVESVSAEKKRMLKWNLTLKILHLIWKKADSVSRGRRYGIRTQISITE